MGEGLFGDVLARAGVGSGGSAVLSPDGLHRYRLERWWPHDPENGPAMGAVLWVMLNPSTADANTDDPTIRRVIGFSSEWRYTRAIVVNLHSVRATDPADIADLPDYGACVADDTLRIAAEQSDEVVVAWGASAGRWPTRAAHVYNLLAASRRRPTELYPRSVWCLGTTKHGHPKHPLYVAAATPRQLWSPS